MTEPDFYLASSDSYSIEKPRSVWSIKRMAIPGRDDLLLAKIAPPITGEGCGSRVQQIDIVLLAARNKGETLFPVREWPVSVFVIRPMVDDIEKRDQLLHGQFENIAWAEVYKTEVDARRKAFRKR